ncbi:hypothetical protein EZS27_021809 [termite gut metagenome]|uniref:Uncharacterized protein n=1 Tax=termite gut metagenome TaxID=433724 RepID=A0A5J4R7U2_9ZZZZ
MKIFPFWHLMRKPCCMGLVVVFLSISVQTAVACTAAVISGK